MLDLLNKRNCPVCGGMLKCENSDFTNHFIEKGLFLNGHGNAPIAVLNILQNLN